MADFLKAYELSMGHEGGYSFDPRDPGGETWKGISRRWNPNWRGWDIVDGAKMGGVLSSRSQAALHANASLNECVQALYKTKYWDTFWGDRIPGQDLANELFDTGINLDPYEAVRYLQAALNRFNYDHGEAPMPGSRRPYLYADLVVDGRFGPATLDAVEKLLKMEKGDPTLLLLDMNVSQWVKYREHPNLEGYARGFAKRAMLPGRRS